MPALFSYVVEHDLGKSPSPSGGYCTLAFCECSQTGVTPSIVELANVGDWVVGTSGKSNRSADHGNLVYAMKVTEKLPLTAFLRDPRFKGKFGNDPGADRIAEQFALISKHFYYFGSEAKPLEHDIEQTGPSYRNQFPEDLITDFVGWLKENFVRGEQGDSCVPPSDEYECPPSSVCRRRNSKARRRARTG